MNGLFKKETPYSALVVAKASIKYSNSCGYWIDNFKLQKLLYYCQVHFICDFREHTKCFSEEIVAWDWGPVVPDVYKQYSVFGAGQIPEFRREKLFGIPSDSKEISENDLEKIKHVVDVFEKFSAIDLMKKTLKEYPWKQARTTKTRTITDKMIRDGYVNHNYSS